GMSGPVRRHGRYSSKDLLWFIYSRRFLANGVAIEKNNEAEHFALRRVRLCDGAGDVIPPRAFRARKTAHPRSDPTSPRAAYVDEVLRSVVDDRGISEESVHTVGADDAVPALHVRSDAGDGEDVVHLQRRQGGDVPADSAQQFAGWVIEREGDVERDRIWVVDAGVGAESPARIGRVRQRQEHRFGVRLVVLGGGDIHPGARRRAGRGVKPAVDQ